MSEWSNYLVHRKEHRYIAKVKTKSGRTRYFYTRQQLQAYYDNLKRAEKELTDAEKRYEQAAKELEEAVATTGGAAGRQASEALTKVRRQQNEAKRQRKRVQNDYDNATRRAQADAKKLEADLNRQFDQQNANQWTQT